MGSKIKSETIYRVDHVPGDEIDPGLEYENIHSYHEYDPDGRLLVEIAYTRDGDIADKMEYRYDEHGNLCETMIYGEDGEILERKEEVWESPERLRCEIIHYLDGSRDNYEYFYDENGALTGVQVTDDEDELEYSEKYFYEGDKLVKIERTDEEGELIYRQETAYEDGRIKSRTTWSSEEEEPYTLVHYFNGSERREKEERFDGDGKLIERNIYEEDVEGRLHRVIEENRQRKNTTEYSFDAKGNPVAQVETDMNGEVNHEISRLYSPEGELMRTTVEIVNKQNGVRMAYSLIFKRENFAD
jgi:YD repeat-containing protein